MRVTPATLLFLCAFLTTWSGWHLVTQAQAASPATEYPNKSVRWIVSVAPGGGTDFVARMYSPKITELLRQSVVVDNRPGATGMIGMELVARAAPDGYSVVVLNIGHLITAALSRGIRFDPVKDFAPVALLATTPVVMVIHPSVNARTIPEFIALARSQPGKLNYASGGYGGVQHVATELLKREAKIDLVHVPYKGSGPSFIDLIAGQVQLTLTSLPAGLPHIKAGRVRALAVMGKARSSAAPDLPTFAESGLPQVAVDIWYGMLAPARTPSAILDKLAQSIATVARVPEFREAMSASGVDPGESTRADFAIFVRSETEKWSKVARDVGISID